MPVIEDAVSTLSKSGRASCLTHLDSWLCSKLQSSFVISPDKTLAQCNLETEIIQGVVKRDSGSKTLFHSSYRQASGIDNTLSV